jgi:hypothetical protein
MTSISVCVPTYERPEMITQLAQTFLVQDHEDRELCVTDDSRSDATERLFASRLKHPSIRYARNAQTLGFAGNLRTALQIARGDIVVILGDDDLFASTDALGEYAKAFEDHPGVHFAYGNLVQVDEELECTLIYPHFSAMVVAPPGAQAIEKLFLRSILITGMALRRTASLDALYPEGDVLFPQVELVGRLLLDHEGMGIPRYLCATRAHPEQLGFRAIQGRDIRGSERHGVVEITAIFERLVASRPELRSVRSRIEHQLATAYLTNLPNEKIITGNRRMSRNLADLVARNPAARHSVALWFVYLGTVLLPRRAVVAVKDRLRRLVLRRRLRRAGLDRSALLETLKVEVETGP